MLRFAHKRGFSSWVAAVRFDPQYRRGCEITNRSGRRRAGSVVCGGHTPIGATREGAKENYTQTTNPLPAAVSVGASARDDALDVLAYLSHRVFTLWAASRRPRA